MGGGRDKFTKRGVNSTGSRLDEDLIAKWKKDKLTRFGNDTVTSYLTNRDELMNTDMSEVDFVLGLFRPSHMDYRLKANAAEQPTLEEMTRKAVEVLRKEPNGFVLFVEGGLIDKGHHGTWARLALDETVEFAKAVAEAAAATSESDTLIVVTSDHSHTMTLAGYPKRGADVLGTTGQLANDNRTYTTLSYANGHKPGYGPTSGGSGGGVTCSRVDVSKDDLTKVNYEYPSLVELDMESHGGDDVMVFARGPWAHLFTGNYEQNQIPLAMAMAAGLSTKPPTAGASSGGNPVRFDTNAGRAALAAAAALILAGHFRPGL